MSSIIDPRTMVYSNYSSILSQLKTSDNFTKEQLDQFTASLLFDFKTISGINAKSRRLYGIPVSFNVQSASSEIFSLLNSKKLYVEKHAFIAFPPEYVFPRNPDINQYLTPQHILKETYSESGSGLSFNYGFTGILNTIKTQYPPYLDRSYYDFQGKKWTKPQIIFEVDQSDGSLSLNQPIDITPYFSNSIVNFSGIATGIYDQLYYYFDGENIVTNYDFSSITDRSHVYITYYKTLNSIRVKAVMKTNVAGISYYTPSVDKYTLILDKQRILN